MPIASPKLPRCRGRCTVALLDLLRRVAAPVSEDSIATILQGGGHSFDRHVVCVNLQYLARTGRIRQTADGLYCIGCGPAACLRHGVLAVLSVELLRLIVA